MTGATFDYKPKFNQPWPPEKVEEYKEKIRENRELILKMSENRIPYAELDRPIDIPLLEDNMTVSMGNMHWHFHREQPFTWWQVRLLRFCLGLTVTKNG